MAALLSADLEPLIWSEPLCAASQNGINRIRHLGSSFWTVEEHDRALVFGRFKEADRGSAGCGRDSVKMTALPGARREGIEALLEGNDEVVAFGVLGDSTGHVAEGADRSYLFIDIWWIIEIVIGIMESESSS